MKDPDVLAPNLNRRLSGVSATVFALVPLQTKQIKIAATGVSVPHGLPFLPLSRIPFLPRRTRIWHARRNNEMMVGLLLKWLCRSRLKLIFTSSSPRKRGGLTRWLVARMDAIVATNAKNAAVMPGTPVIISHGVDTDSFRPGTADVFDAQGQKLIGCFGRVRAKKGTDVFVSAMCELLPDHPEFDAVILGRIAPDHRKFADDLKAQIARAGLTERIRFAEELPVTEMPRAYQSLDLYVAPSLLEGFGLTPLEAMACGVPTVASRDVGTFNDQIQDGHTGALFPAGDSQALASALRPYLSDAALREKSSIAARAHVMAEFSLQKEAGALIDLYQKLLNEAPH
ncbi:glycosyltransferase family 4 protein [Cognatishimia sp. SS12]|uniref:glycosyltransferase family 4 protein n=1 Tax=Cognatishimia sp. SS12 TaxID=2979465 RepID=UPI003FA40DF5